VLVFSPCRARKKGILRRAASPSRSRSARLQPRQRRRFAARTRTARTAGDGATAAAWATSARAGLDGWVPHGMGGWLRCPSNEFEVMPEHADQSSSRPINQRMAPRNRDHISPPPSHLGGHSGPAQSWKCSGELITAQGDPQPFCTVTLLWCAGAPALGRHRPSLLARPGIVGESGLEPGRWQRARTSRASSRLKCPGPPP